MSSFDVLLGSVIGIFCFYWRLKLLFHLGLLYFYIYRFRIVYVCISTARNGMVAFSYIIYIGVCYIRLLIILAGEIRLIWRTWKRYCQLIVDYVQVAKTAIK